MLVLLRLKIGRRQWLVGRGQPGVRVALNEVLQDFRAHIVAFEIADHFWNLVEYYCRIATDLKIRDADPGPARHKPRHHHLIAIEVYGTPQKINHEERMVSQDSLAADIDAIARL